VAEAAVAGEQRRSPLALFVAVLLIPAVLGSSKTIFNDGDVSWHIATGQWILDHRAIPHVDPFSFTWAGKPWVPIEWLAEVIYASAYRLGGYGGVAALVTAVLMALHAIVYFNAARWTRLALLPIVAMDFVLIPMLLARPHLLTWPLLALWTWLMLRAREQDRAPPLAAALLMALWANLHGGFVFGLAIAGAFGLEALIVSADKPRVLRQWLVFGLLCVHQWQRRGGRHPPAALHPVADAPADRRVEAVEPSQDALLFCGPGVEPGTDRLEAATAAVGTMATARRPARSRSVPGAAPGDAGDRRGDGPSGRICARRGNRLGGGPDTLSGCRGGSPAAGRCPGGNAADAAGQ
jgi:hypothetical protein